MGCNPPTYFYAKLRSRWKRTSPARASPLTARPSTPVARTSTPIARMPTPAKTSSPPLVLDQIHTPEPSSSTELTIMAAGSTRVPTPHSSPVPAPQPVPVPASQSSVPASVNPQRISKSLWEQAIDKLDEEDRKGLNFADKSNIKIFPELMKAIEEKQKDCLEKRWSYQNSSGKKVYVRDSVDAFLEQVNKYASIGDVIIQHHPDIVALAWAGFRFLLQVATSDVQNMKIVIESMDSLVRVLSRCDIYEKLYCGQDHDSTQPLDGSMVDLYVSVLQYLSCARRYLEKPTAGRVLGSMLSDIKPLLDKVELLEQAVTRDASIAHQQALTHELFKNDLKMTQLLALLEAMKEPSRRMEGMIMAIYTSIQRAERGKVLAWISKMTSSDHHIAVSNPLYPDTGRWLFLKDSFRNWEDSDSSSLFWLCGGAGSGKTMLACVSGVSLQEKFTKLYRSKMIDRAKPESTQYGRAYFYCNYKEDNRRDPASILRSLVKQLCQGSPDGTFSQRVLSIYEKREDDGNLESLLSIVESQKLLIELSAGFKSTTILIDALDECHEETRAQLLDVFEHILSLTELNPIKIFVTGRNDGDLRTRLEKFGNIFIQEGDNSSDIDYYIGVEVQTCISNGRLLHGKVEDDLKVHIIDVLRKGAHGMFIWVQHQVHSICAMATPDDVRDALTGLPNGLENSYKQVLKKIDDQSSATAAHARRILMWILFAFEPLRPDELLEALSVKAGKSEFTSAGLTVAKALEICHNLVLVDVAQGVLRFTHFSVQEFLLSYYNSADAHTSIATICLTLLTHHHTTICHDHQAPSLTSGYSTCNWRQHVISSGLPTDELVRYCHEFCEHRVAFESWYSSTDIGAPRVLSGSPAHRLVGPALLAPAFRLQNLLERDLNSGVDPNLSTAEGFTALHLAAMNGDLHGIKFMLLRDGVDADRADEQGRTPLSIVAQSGHQRAITCFLQDDRVYVNCHDKAGRTPLSWAAASPTHGMAVKLLLKDKRIDLNLGDNSSRTPLWWAVRSRNERAVYALVTARADVNIEDKHGRTPLSWAASNGDIKIVNFLLKGAPKVGRHTDKAQSRAATAGNGLSTKNNPLRSSYGDIPDKDGCTPLLWAIKGGNLKVSTYLTTRSTHINTPDNTGLTPLLSAVMTGSSGVVSCLAILADVNKVDADGRTPLSWAAGNGDTKAITALLKNKAIDLKAVDKSGRSAMDWAVEKGHQEAVRVLKNVQMRKKRTG